MNKFEQVSSDDHQMSVVAGGGKSNVSSDNHQMSVAGEGQVPCLQ